MLDRVAGPDDVRRAVYLLRDAGFDNISLDLIYGIPGQSAAELASDLAEALALEPEHLSAYELEAKPGTRFTHAHGAELERQAESMESYFELVVETLTARRLPLVRDGELLPGLRDSDCGRVTGATCGRGTTSATGSGTTTSASAWALSAQSRIGAGGTRLRSRGYVEALAAGRAPAARARGAVARGMRETERVMLGLRLDEPVIVDGVERTLDPAGLERLERLGLADAVTADAVALTARGRFLGDGVTAPLLA